MSQPDRIVVRCPSCRRRLGLPVGRDLLTVTCPACKHRWDEPPPPLPPAEPRPPDEPDPAEEPEDDEPDPGLGAIRDVVFPMGVTLTVALFAFVVGRAVVRGTWELNKSGVLVAGVAVIWLTAAVVGRGPSRDVKTLRWREMSPRERCPVGCVTSGVLAVVVSVVLGITYTVKNTSDLTGYVESLALTDQLKEVPGKFSGKVVLFDAKAKAVHGELYLVLPEGLKATKPEHVAAVALLDFGKSRVGTYAGGAPALRHYCDVRVLDVATRAVIGRKRISGASPPDQINARLVADREPVEGEPVDLNEIVAYLQELRE